MDQVDVTFNIQVTMYKRWVPHFLGMLKRMQYLGGIGSSRRVSIYSDGDGDFRPIFEWSNELPEPAGPAKQGHNEDQVFDAG